MVPGHAASLGGFNGRVQETSALWPAMDKQALLTVHTFGNVGAGTLPIAEGGREKKMPKKGTQQGERVCILEGM